MSTTEESTFDEGPRPFKITSDDQRGVVVSVAVLFILYAFMIIGLRLSARIRGMGIDDWLAIFATVFSIAQFATVIGAVSHLLGVSYDQYSEEDAASVANILRASEVLFFISLFIAKCAVIWLCRRLFSITQKAPRMLCGVLMAISGVWCLASILAVTVSCDAEAAIGLDNGTCPGLVRRWTIVGILDAVTEIVVIALSVVVVWPLRMSFAKRLSAMTCFLFRLPIILFIVLHLHYLATFENDSNKGVSIIRPVIFRQAELLFSLFSAAIPALNQYLRKFSTTGATTFGYTPGSYGDNYGLRSITRPSRANHSYNATTSGREFGPESHSNYKATVDYVNTKTKDDSSADGRSLSRHNSDDMIIRKDVVYEVSYSDGDGRSGPAGKSKPSR